MGDDGCSAVMYSRIAAEDGWCCITAVATADDDDAAVGCAAAGTADGSSIDTRRPPGAREAAAFDALKLARERRNIRLYQAIARSRRLQDTCEAIAS